MTVLAWALGALAWLLVAHAAVNALLLRRLPAPQPVDEPVSLLVPARDEAERIGACVRALLRQRWLSDVEVLVLDDCSSDDTAAVASAASDEVRVLAGTPTPAGWVGKTHACRQLADAARGGIFVFVDADVVVTDDAVARTVSLLRSRSWQLASPYPRQLAGSLTESLVQPLLQWSWLTFLPLRLSERARRPSLVAANGQFLAVDAACYRAAGGHAAVRDAVVDDIALARAIHAAGGRGGIVDGTTIATCRMYDGPRALVAGYAKSLWVAFGSAPGALAVCVLLVLLYVLPWVLVAVVSPWWWLVAAAGPAGRLVAAVRTGARPWVAAVAQPLSVLVFVLLVTVSLTQHRRGRLTWKGRALP